MHHEHGRVYNEYIVMRNVIQNDSATLHVLLALVPYTQQNLTLAFHPNKFFNDLEKISHKSINGLRTAYDRAIKRGLIHIDNRSVSLSLHARQAVQPYIAQTLSSGGQLMVIFDIPEELAPLRQQLRNTLKKLLFVQIQQSVWMTEMDHRSIVIETINDLNIRAYVQLYEAARLPV